jgi:hypothetical protein
MRYLFLPACLLAAAVAAAFGCTERPGSVPPGITPPPPHDTTHHGDTDTTVVPPPNTGGATGRLAYTFDTLKSAAVGGAPPAWICVPDSGVINDSVSVSSTATTPAGSATLAGLACQAAPDSISGGAITVIVISDTTAKPLTASWSQNVYTFQFPYDGATLSLSGRWSDAADTAMTGTSISLTLPDGHVLSGSWSGRKE